jgi:hypothetical protein
MIFGLFFSPFLLSILLNGQYRRLDRQGCQRLAINGKYLICSALRQI